MGSHALVCSVRLKAEVLLTFLKSCFCFPRLLARTAGVGAQRFLLARFMQGNQSVESGGNRGDG